MRAFLLSFLLTILAASAAAQVRVEVREQPKQDLWRVEIVHPRRVNGVVFDVSRIPFREGRWRIVEPRDARWALVAGKDAIVFRRPGRKLVLEFRSDFRPREKDYHVNIAFTDGGRLLYTGHLRTRPLIGVNILDPKVEVEHRWTFFTEKSRDIRALARRGVGRLDWPLPAEPGMDDTYVYFGRLQPVLVDRDVILDPGLPEWVLRDMERFIPQQFAFFEKQLGIELDAKPLVLLTWSGDKTPGYSFAGGTLPGVVQIALQGAGWTTPSDDSSRLWYQRLAHEIFHLWGGEMFTPEPDAEWLSEGAAEYFALLALRDAGMLDRPQFEREIVEAANECIAGLGGQPLVRSLELGRPRNFYTCGAVLHFLADDGQLAQTFRDLFQQSRRKGRRFSTADFEALLRDPASVHRLVFEGIATGVEDYLAELLRGKGLGVTLAPPAEATVNPATRLALGNGASHPSFERLLRWCGPDRQDCLSHTAAP